MLLPNICIGISYTCQWSLFSVHSVRQNNIKARVRGREEEEENRFFWGKTISIVVEVEKKRISEWLCRCCVDVVVVVAAATAV